MEENTIVDVPNTENEVAQVDVVENTVVEPTAEPTEDLQARVAKAEQIASDQKIRAEKAEAKLKNPKVETATPKQDTDNTPSSHSDLEKGRIYSRIDNSEIPADLADEAFDRVNKVAQINEVSLNEAYASEDFKSWEERKLREVKAEKAQLPASRGGKAEVKKTLDTVGLSDEDHKALWKERV